MKESLALTQQQRLQQRLHPEQMLFGRLLEMSAPELEDEVHRVVDENPALIEKDTVAEDSAADSGEFSESAEQLQRADYADDDDVPFIPPSARHHYDTDRDYDLRLAASGQTLQEALKAQLTDHDLTEAQRTIAEYVIDSLDDNGYMTRSPRAIADDMSATAGMEVSLHDVAPMVQLVRSLEPAGVGATSLQDCMSLQLKRMKQSPGVQLALKIVEKKFEAFSKRRSERLRASLGCTKEELEQAIEIIRGLNPKPGNFADESSESRTQYIEPDFSVEIDSDGRATVGLTGHLPELAIEESFIPSASPAAGRHEREAQAFIRARHDDARSFIKMLTMRNRTMLAIMKAIVSRQRDFFTTADRSTIRPMIMRDIAADTGYDLSVISRATAGKYVATASGIYPVKMFFNDSPFDDTDVTGLEIADRIKLIIQGEDKNKPLNDQAICEALKAGGIDIARRTVAKYRENMGFPVARLRKKF